MNIRHLIHTLLATIICALPTAGMADDTDLYMTTSTVARDDSPNVLIILDNSGSMDTDVEVSAPAYNPATDYSAVAGAPTDIVDGRIYFGNTTGSPPPADTNQWFLATNNNCEASITPMATTGYYGSDPRVIYYDNSSSKTRRWAWKDLEDNDAQTKVVDCRGDQGAPINTTQHPDDATMYDSTKPADAWWADFHSKVLFNANYMRYIHNPTLTSGTRTRLEIAKDALKSIVDANPSVRFGLMVFNRNDSWDGSDSGNHGGRVIMKVDTMDDARRTTMKNTIDSLAANTWTPLAETLWEARRYFGGLTVDYGDNYTGSPARDLTAEVAGKYISPFQLACQQSYIIYMTDGEPRIDENADSRMGTMVGGCDAEAGLNSDGGISCLDDLAGWMYNNDVYDGLPGQQRVITYTIGFGSGLSAAAVTLLKETASRGQGQYYPANSVSELTDAFQGALVDITATTASFAAPALSVNAFNSLYHRDEVFFAMFKPSSTEYWHGNVKKYKLCADPESTACNFGEVLDRDANPAIDPMTLTIKDTAKSYWGTDTDGNVVELGGAGAQIPAPASRKVYTYTGGYDATNKRTPTGTVDLSNTVNRVAVSNTTNLTAAMLGAVDATEREKVINWMNGIDAYDDDGDGDATESHWSFSDAMHSRPLVVTYGAELTAGVPDPDKPIVKLLVGTNDGGLRLVNEKTGQEEWAFVPKELLSIQQGLAVNGNGTHPYGMDGTSTIWIQDNNHNGIIEPGSPENDKIYAYVGMRRGGRNLYAVDITPSATLTDAASITGITPKLLWAIQGDVSTGYADLGQTWSRPLISTIRYGTATAGESISKTVLMFAGGYDDGQDAGPFPSASGDSMGNAIYIVDPTTGERLWWASGAGSGADLELTNMDFSIPSDLSVVDSNGDGASDRVYVGDTAGQVWRLDLSPTLKLNNNGTPASSGHVLADIACPLGTRLACTGTTDVDRRKFFYPPSVAQIFDTTTAASGEEKYDIITIASGNRADPLDLDTGGILVHNGIYVLRDYDTDVGPYATYQATLNLGSLLDVTTRIPTTDLEREALEADLKTKEGWYIQLSDAGSWVGEKSLAQTTIFSGTLYVTTYLPRSDTTAATTCSPNEGLGRVYALNLLTGAPTTDFDDDGDEDRFGNVGGGIPSETVIIIREEGVTGLVDTTLLDKISKDLPRYKTYWYH